ncbi:MAG: flippase [Verrucomicrobiota bacterium]
MKIGTQVLISNSVWSILYQAVRVGTLAGVTIALSRHFGPQRFGSLAFGLAFVRIFAVVAAFGLDRVLVRHLAEPGAENSRVVRSIFGLKLIIAVASYLALLGFVWAIAGQDRLLLAIVVLAGAGLLFQPLDVFDYTFQARNRFRLTFLGRGLPTLCSAGLKIGAVLWGAPLLVFAFLETLEAGLIGGALLLIHRTVSRERVKAAPPVLKWRPLLAQGFPLLLGSLAVMIYMRTDVLMLGKMAGYRAAGIYSAAAQVSEACTLVSVALVPALFPILLRWRALGLGFYHRQFEKLFLVAFLSGLAVALILTIFAPVIVRSLFGDQFLSATTVLRILAWVPVFVFLGVTQSGYDITEGLTWMATLRTAAGAVINIGLNLVLIPRYGPMGAAAATVIAQAFPSVLLNISHRKTQPIFAMQMRALCLIPLFRAKCDWDCFPFKIPRES